MREVSRRSWPQFRQLVRVAVAQSRHNNDCWHSDDGIRQYPRELPAGKKNCSHSQKKDNFGGTPMKKIQPIFAAITLSIAGSFLALAQQPQQQAPPQPM